MSAAADLEALWNAYNPAPVTFDPARIAHHAEPVRRYLTHAIAPGTPLANAVRLRMHGELKLGEWCPFDAEQVIRWDRGFVWRARVTKSHLPITGADEWIDGEGSMRWRILGIVPVATGSGRDISRSALGRVQCEAMWLPSVLLSPDVTWEVHDETHLGVSVRMRGEAAVAQLTLDPSGALQDFALLRWGNPEKQEFHDVPFGGLVERERTFGGYTIPSCLRIGWWYGTDRFAGEGEFFRGSVDDVAYR
ncbi:MAG: hypothetical protein IT379_28050 [Deltaproteobacteria bacterium]|nr:hypothetical protein [Deltaproteobacteria bacterium]